MPHVDGAGVRARACRSRAASLAALGMLGMVGLLGTFGTIGCAAAERGEEARDAAEPIRAAPNASGAAANASGVAANASGAAANASAPARDEQGRASSEGDSDVRITISAVGDCALGDLAGVAGEGSFTAELAKHADPIAYPFARVRALFAADDLTIANLEGTLTNHDGRANPVFAIRGKPEWAEMLAQGSVELVNLANNHSHDFGFVGHEDTKRALDRAKVGRFGHGVVDRREVRGVTVVNLGYLGGPQGTQARVVRDVAREAKPGTIVVVSFHWGIEGSHATAPDQQRLGRAAIDAGASLVLGHHPHVLQGIETYRDRHIVYSLGNFVFGAHSQPADMDSLVFQETFHVRDGKVHAVAERRVPVRISSSTRRNDFRPTLLEGDEAARVLDKVAKFSASIPAS